MIPKQYFCTAVLICFIISACKKKETRALIRHYTGTYSVTHIHTWCCDSLGHYSSTAEQMELEVKKSLSGVKIRGIEVFDHFKVNNLDSTLHAWKKGDEPWAYGKFYPNDSISLSIRLSSKLPFGHYYRMIKK